MRPRSALSQSKIRLFFEYLAAGRISSADWVAPLCVLALSVISVVFIQSAQSYTGARLWMGQSVWVGVGFGIYYLISRVNYQFFFGWSTYLYILSIIPLLLLWTPLGMRAYGSLRWLDFKFFSIQPSEIAKIGTLLLAASVLARSKIDNFRDSLGALIRVGAVFALPTLLIFLQPDLGSALVFPPMLFALLYVSNLTRRFFYSVFAVFAVLVGLVTLDVYKYQEFLQANELSALRDAGAYEEHSLLPLKDYQRNRILAFAAPEIIDPQGTGASWNLRQSLIAVGSGGFWGKGLQGSIQAKLGYLPRSVACNDFIFSVIAEEVGFVGGCALILILAVLIINNLRIASAAKDRFGMFLCVGVSTIFIVHIFVNIGMTIGIMPITGISLPFISYGGSFIVSCFILQGLVQSVWRFRSHHV